MGWGTEFKCDVYFNKQTFNSEFELKDKIKELEEQSKNCREQILMFCAASPKDLTSEDWKDDSIRFVHFEVTRLIEELSQISGELMKLYLAEENFDTMIKT